MTDCSTGPVQCTIPREPGTRESGKEANAWTEISCLTMVSGTEHLTGSTARCRTEGDTFFKINQLTWARAIPLIATSPDTIFYVNSTDFFFFFTRSPP